jgi:hypothetical protein
MFVKCKLPLLVFCLTEYLLDAIMCTYLFSDLMLTALYGELSKITDHKVVYKENGNIQRVFLQVRRKDSQVKTQTNKQTNKQLCVAYTPPYTH